MKVIHKDIFIFSIICVTVGLAFSPYHALLSYPLKADDASYLSHAFTLGLDFNLRYENNIANWLSINGISAAHPIGPGLLAAPFVGFFSIIDYLSDHAIISNVQQYQFSWARFGFVFATVFYFLAGVLLYHKALEKAKIAISPVLTLLLCSSFGVLYYVLFRPTMGHSYEFFALALCCYTTTHMIFSLVENRKISFIYPFLLAFSLNLTILIRPANIIVTILPLILFYLYGMTHLVVIAQYRKQFFSCLIKVMLWFLLLFSFVAAINLNLYNMIFPSATAMYGTVVSTMPSLSSLQDVLNAIGTLILRLPKIATVIFSSEFGLLFASPILIIGLILLVEILLKAKSKISDIAVLLVLLGVYLGLPLATVLFWQSQGDAYGFRFLFSWFPVAFISFCLWLQLRGTESRYVIYLKGFVIAFCLFGLLSSTFYGINSKLMYHQVGRNCFDIPGGNAVGYQKEVLKACAVPNAWLQLTATRFPGFMLFGMAELFNYKINADHLPENLKLKLQQWQNQNQSVSKAIYLQSLIIYLFILSFIWIYLRRGPVRSSKP